MTSGDLWRRLVAVALLAAASLVLYGWVPQYRLVGAELLQNADFASGFDHWRKSDGSEIAAGVVTLRNDVPGRIVGIDQMIGDPAPGYYSFAAEVRPTAVVRGAEGGNLARLALASVDRAGAARWGLPHIVVLLAGSGGWQRSAGVFRVPPASSALWAIVQLFSARGTFEVRHLSVRRAEPLPAFLQASRALLGLWVLAGLWIGWPLLVMARRDRRIAVVVLVGLGIGVATQMPNAGKTELLLLIQETEAHVATLVQSAPPIAGASGSTAEAATTAGKGAEAHFSWHGLDKIGHFLMHVLLGAATLWAFRQQSRTMVLLCLFCFAGVTEVWQNFAIDRDPLLSDALINIGGVLTGALLTLAALRLLQPRVRPADPPAA